MRQRRRRLQYGEPGLPQHAWQRSCETCPLPHYIPKDGVCFNRDTCTLGGTPDSCAPGSFCETNPAGFYTCAPEYGARCDCIDDASYPQITCSF